MEARVTIVGSEQLFLGMVADGHGGKGASVLCREKFLDFLLDAADGSADAKSLRAAARKAFARAHDAVLALDPPTTAGATLTVCMINPARREVTCAHVGDSIALLVPRDGTAAVTELCEDHRIDT
eukprot:6562082-Prymnesium_polylepis.1